ncbi:hypothetical protein TSAR_016565 [Trichomalopsis sarcophagae]|uniref:Uncharacterized protein n=1 Tax=Trichomalopsis sarcophagae TaxID=543379 RepID=A0A232EUH5_9HYME|nr:hypothetical protein TSAR_016565 [Trichomalopsis sarcophagae]
MARFRRRSISSGYLVSDDLTKYRQSKTAQFMDITLWSAGLQHLRLQHCHGQLFLCYTNWTNWFSVPAEVERDLKLMSSILGIEHYTLIMLGAITDYPMLHAPWLLMQSCMIGLELLVFLVRLFLEGLHVSRDQILISILSLHNWLQVFCLFQRQTSRRSGAHPF